MHPIESANIDAITFSTIWIWIHFRLSETVPGIYPIFCRGLTNEN